MEICMSGMNPDGCMHQIFSLYLEDVIISDGNAVIDDGGDF